MKNLRSDSIYLKTVLKICIWLFMLIPGQAFCASNSFVPPSGKTLLFVGQNRDTIVHYVRATGNIPGGTMFYTSVQRLEGLDSPTDYGSGPQDAGSLLQTYPNSAIQIGLYMVDELSDINAGRYDDNLKTLAQWIKNANRPVYLRIGYEFDNPDNHYDPKQYKQAYRHVVDVLRNEGVKNAAYVWHSETAVYSGQDWMAWYPGDDYVDWFGASIFQISQIQSFVSNFLNLARQHAKPFMICESSAWKMSTAQDKIDWFDHIFQFIKDQHIKAFCYINSNWDALPLFSSYQFGDARIEKNTEVKKHWLNEIDQDRYLKASPDLFQLLGWVKSK